jgi:hypothetical protein
LLLAKASLFMKKKFELMFQVASSLRGRRNILQSSKICFILYYLLLTIHNASL